MVAFSTASLRSPRMIDYLEPSASPETQRGGHPQESSPGPCPAPPLLEAVARTSLRSLNWHNLGAAASRLPTRSVSIGQYSEDWPLRLRREDPSLEPLVGLPFLPASPSRRGEAWRRRSLRTS